MIDKTYLMNDAGSDSEVLLTTDNPRSMKTLAWTRQYKKARVFCYQAGHDNQTYTDPNFRRIVSQGIKWLARKI
jgi:type 1 glutamine amidotransferase